MRSLNAKTALAGGLLASIGASICCVGPLVLLGLGIGGAWIGNLTALEPYRPIFLILTLLFLGLACRKLYASSPTCCLDAACSVQPSRRTQRILFWIAAPLLLLLAASPWWLTLLYR